MSPISFFQVEPWLLFQLLPTFSVMFFSCYQSYRLCNWFIFFIICDFKICDTFSNKWSIFINQWMLKNLCFLLDVQFYVSQYHSYCVISSSIFLLFMIPWFFSFREVLVSHCNYGVVNFSFWISRSFCFVFQNYLGIQRFTTNIAELYLLSI